MCNDTTVSKLKNDFHYTLSKFSHELRNPLTLINSGLQMIASAHPEVKEYEHWDDVMDNLDYVKELLDELSAFNNAGHVKRENIDTCSYLRTILSSIKPTLDYLEITLEADIPDSLPSIALDRIRVRQMLLNLLKNAWEAVPIPGGKISFSVIPLSIRRPVMPNPFKSSKEKFLNVLGDTSTIKSRERFLMTGPMDVSVWRRASLLSPGIWREAKTLPTFRSFIFSR